MAFRIMTVLVAGMVLRSTMYAQVMEEYQLKAAFLYKFANFVEWPPQSFKTATAPMTVCVLGSNPFGNALESVLEGKSIAGRRFVFREVADAASARTCQMLFVAASESKRFRSMFANFKPVGVLTVGESEEFVSAGGVINFKLEDGHVRFEINLDEAEHEQLHISSKLLNLAQILRSEKAR